MDTCYICGRSNAEVQEYIIGQIKKLASADESKVKNTIEMKKIRKNEIINQIEIVKNSFNKIDKKYLEIPIIKILDLPEVLKGAEIEQLLRIFKSYENIKNDSKMTLSEMFLQIIEKFNRQDASLESSIKETKVDPKYNEMIEKIYQNNYLYELTLSLYDDERFRKYNYRNSKIIPKDKIVNIAYNVCMLCNNMNAKFEDQIKQLKDTPSW